MWLPPIDRPSPSPVTTNTLRSRRATMDRVEAVRVHVVREPARAADARDEHDVLARDTEVRHGLLHGAQDGVVTAARAPADVLVGLEILLRVLGRRRGRRPCPLRAHGVLPMS